MRFTRNAGAVLYPVLPVIEFICNKVNQNREGNKRTPIGGESPGKSPYTRCWASFLCFLISVLLVFIFIFYFSLFVEHSKCSTLSIFCLIFCQKWVFRKHCFRFPICKHLIIRVLVPLLYHFCLKLIDNSLIINVLVPFVSKKVKSNFQK